MSDALVGDFSRPLFGRSRELQQLRVACQDAIAGNGSLWLIAGEPGIGKTALCEQIASEYSKAGGLSVFGHCYEEGSLSLPYLAFIEAIRAYLSTRDDVVPLTEPEATTAEVSRIVPELRSGRNLPESAGDPSSDRWRLLQSVTDFLYGASRSKPLLLVLEDLHWADRGTLDLLLHLSRGLTDSHLLVLGTYRDVDVDRNHPLSGTLAELRRVPSYRRIDLRGLSPTEVLTMISALAGQEVSEPTAQAIFRQTEGNPLFVQEIQRYLEKKA